MMEIQKNESQHVEFKQSWRDDCLKWICAFANTDGGTLYIGVSDNGEVCGVEDEKKLMEDIPNKILHTMGLICAVNLLGDNEKKYFQIVVEKYPIPVSYHGKYYKRSGSTTQEVTGYELDKMILAVHGRTWDSVPVPYVTVDDLDNDAIKLFKTKALQYNRLDNNSLDVSNEMLLRNLRLYENDYLTKAAVMCFHPDPEKFVTCAYIKIGFFADNDADILYQDEVHGPLIMQVEKTLDLIYTKYMKALISYDGIYRMETFFFPREAFRELLLNAVIHRDYMCPTPIQIRVYEHKIRIWNIGQMPSEVPVEKLYEPHSSAPRNPNIANVFFKAGYVESWGRGYRNISDICDLRKAKLPIPEENTGGLVVECPPSEKYLLAEKGQGKMITEIEELNVPINVPTNVPINDRQKKILECIVENKLVTMMQLSKLLAVSDKTIKRDLQFLKENNLIKRVGANKNGCWKIVPTPPKDEENGFHST